MLDLLPYNPALHRDLWDSFVDSSRNATFLLRRGYMDYHADRFTDCSLLFTDSKGRVAALLPASRHDDKVISHGGLTYGGLVIGRDTDVMTVCEAFDLLTAHYRAAGAKELIYKPIPTIYQQLPSQEDLYALFLHNAQMTTCNISSAVDLTADTHYNENTTRNIRKALRRGVTVEISDDLSLFYPILSELLDTRYSTAPVHTLPELLLLKERFPREIRLYLARVDGRPVAGSLIYITPTVYHTQYIAASGLGKETLALSPLFDRAIRDARSDGARYFDFGTSNGDNGRYLNTGLIRQKNGFGARAIAYPAFTLPLASVSEQN